jgi:glycosyltransferase involved in cell wall biosynthesis
MKVCIIAFSHLARDGRVLRQIESMSHVGEVITIGYGLTPQNSSRHFSIPDNLKYLPLNVTGLVLLFLRRFRRAYNVTPAVAWTIRALKEVDVDLVILNDVQTIGLIDWLGTNEKKIIDMHEFAPEEMADDWRFRLLLQKYYVYLCANFLKQAQVVLTVSDAIANEFEKRFSINCDVITNSCKYFDLEPSALHEGPIRLVHAGLASKGRHIETMIQAAGDVDGVQLDLYLVPAPRQIFYYRKLKRYAQRHSNVKLQNPVKSDDLVATLNRYDVGLLVISPSNFSLANCLPNKLFEFVQARLMIIAGPTPDVAAVVEQHEIGVVTTDFSPNELSRVLSNLTKRQVASFKQKTTRAAEKLHFESESQKLHSVVRVVCSQE